MNSENEAKSLLSYMKCKLPNLLLSLRKSSQDISEATCKWIPLPPLTNEWTDDMIYTYYNLTEDEIKLIKDTKVNGYKDIKLNNDDLPTIIKDGQKQYYLIDSKLYKIKKDKSRGDIFSSYTDGHITEDFDNKKCKSTIKKTNKKTEIFKKNKIK